MPAAVRRRSSGRSSLNSRLLALAVLAALAGPAAAQLQFEELGKRGLPSSAGRATATAFGDVDGDGDLDLVVGIDGQVLLCLNNGSGAFTDATATRMPVGGIHIKSLLLGDVDGDGDLDLIVGCLGRSRLYLNNGAGTFVDATTTSLPPGNMATNALALGDVDGDGDLDLVSAYAAGQRSGLYLNNGAGIFTDATVARMPSGSFQAFSVALGDVDGDGDLDMVLGTGSSSSQPNRLYLNNGTGFFADATATRMPVGLYNTRSVLLGDVDGDGDLDLVVGNVAQQNCLYLNNGTGWFTDATVARMPVGSYYTTALALRDVDGDGDLDLVVGNYAQQGRLYLNNGAGTFTDATATRMPVGTPDTGSLRLGDVDGDGDLDLVVESVEQRTRLYLNNGSGRFADATTSSMPTFAGTTALAMGDVDGDGDLDLVVGRGGTAAAQCSLMLNDGRGIFSDATAARMPIALSTIASVVLGDVDGDGDLDLVIGDSSQNVLLYLNDGTGTFTDVTASRMPVSGRVTSLAMGDVDGDGDLDLVVASVGAGSQYGQSRLYLNNGTGTFTDVTATRMPSGLYDIRSVVLGDVDGDGDLDLALGNVGYITVSTSSNRLYLNDGTGRFTATAGYLPAVGNDPTSSLAFGDVDGDGDLDLVLGSAGQWYSQWIQNKYGGYWSHSLIPGQSRLYLNNGRGIFSDATATHLPDVRHFTSSLALADLDEDGDLDLVHGNHTNFSVGSQSRVYLNNGLGRFVDATTPRMPFAIERTQALALGDLDGDGDLDLVLGNVGQRRQYWNLLRQLDAPSMLRAGRTYHLDFYSRYGPATQIEIALPFFSTNTAHIPLPPFGTLGIDPNRMVALPPVLVPQPEGIGSLAIPVPNLPALAGITIYTQALLQQHPVQLRLTNVVGDIVLR